MINIHKGPYRGKGEDGQPDNRILYVTAVCPDGDVVTYCEFLDTCTFRGILRMGLGKKDKDYTRVTFAEFADLVAHELVDQDIEWRREGQIICCTECGNELALEEADDGVDAYPCVRCIEDAHAAGYHKGLHDGKTGQQGPLL